MTTTKLNMTLKDVEEFRKQWQTFIRLTIKGEFVEPVSMVNSGYLHTLNASFDGLFLREQQSDSLLTANRRMNFGTIQPCIRTEDKLAIKKSPLHLGLFEICGFSILDFPQVTAKYMAEKTIKEFLVFYTDYLKLDKKLLRVYYFGGGSLRNITKGRIKSDDYIEPDNFSVNIWKGFGLNDNQLIPEFTNETFLLHMGNPLREHHSGYRNDIFVESKNVDFEIGTLNFISYQTVIEQGKIIGIKLLPFYLREMAIGQERFLAAIAGTRNLYNLPYINSLLQAVLRKLKDERVAMVYTDALRVIHYFFSDGWTYEKLRGRGYREHRHELNKFMEIITGLGKDLTKNQQIEILRLNSELQPWYPKLKSGIKTAVGEIEAYKRRKQD
jgi:alanyl-tRNA synthetase